MARIRSLKPSFFTDSELAGWPPLHRLAFQGLWVHADREGRLEDKPRELKVKILPFDECDLEAVLTDLARPREFGPGFIVRYRVGGKRYIAVTGWKHQKPHPKEPKSDIPGPDKADAVFQPEEAGKENGKTVAEQGPTSGQQGGFLSLGSGSLVLGPCSLQPVVQPEPVLQAILPAEAFDLEPDPAPARAAPEDRVFEHWRRVLKKNGRTAFDDKRKGAVKKMLNAGYTADDLCAAVDGCALTPHNMGQNSRGEPFNDLALICRDAEHVDRFIANAASPPKGPARDLRKGTVAAEHIDWNNAQTGVIDDLTG